MIPGRDYFWGISGGYIVLNRIGSIPLAVIEYVRSEAIDMLYSGDDSRDLEADGLVGRMTTKGEVQNLGTFSGRRFDARFETEEGDARLSIIVKDMTTHAPYPHGQN